MKKSFVISLGGQQENARKWQKELELLSGLGYEGVELAIRDPKAININTLENYLLKNKLEVSAIGTGQAYVYDGLSLSSLNKSIRGQAIERIRRHIDLAGILRTQVIIGLIRGKSDGIKSNEEYYKKNLKESVKCICDYAVLKGIILTLEPINRYETSFLNNVTDAIAFIKNIGCNKLKIIMDTFHMNIEEKDFITPIIKARKYLSHFHLADNNRMCPGQGHIDFRGLIKILRKIGYSGYLSAEVLPLPNFYNCASNFLKNIRRYS